MSRTTAAGRKASWLWNAFSNAEQLSTFVNELSVVCHIWIIQRLSKKWHKTGFKWGCTELTPLSTTGSYGCPTSTSLTRTCCHLVGYNRQNALGPLTQQMPLDGVSRALNPYYFRCPAAQVFWVSRSYRPRITVQLKRTSPTAFSFMRHPRLQISKYNNVTIFWCQHNLPAPGASHCNTQASPQLSQRYLAEKLSRNLRAAVNSDVQNCSVRKSWSAVDMGILTSRSKR